MRARKTVQSRTIGKRSVRHINQQMVFINRAEGVNPRLGTFSVWVRLIILYVLIFLFLFDPLCI